MSEVSQIIGSKLTSPFLELLPITGVAISVFDQNRRPAMLHSTDLTAAHLEELHFDLGEGPLFDAFASGSLVSIPDLATTERWPVFLHNAAELEVGAIFVFPLMLGAVCSGAVLCYRKATGPLADSAAAIGTSLSRAIAGPAFREAIQLAVDEPPDELAPIEWRRQVHQATGMVIAQLNITATDAFSRIRAYAFSSGHTVQEVATEVVTRRLNLAEFPE
ncbi:GAF and ANTAR domain-containing protein [Cryobacterium sp. N22]|uniref:GAF and ANTAR domain-containing protein n=1 Tax=Cryobacterium sp. N22 TaxID=2048290 RepID=UPI000CE4ECD4|nr:GAF and ANTAR domain-containing protein [Cryobacterium sp. N22]